MGAPLGRRILNEKSRVENVKKFARANIAKLPINPHFTLSALRQNADKLATPDGAFAIENIRSHDRAMFGKGVG
jgi:hypothetical protein